MRSLSTQSKKTISIDWLALWILYSTWCSVSGWTLSVCGQLNRIGYAAAAILFVAVLVLFGRNLGLWSKRSSFRLGRFAGRRFLSPKLWLGLTLLLAMGGSLYHPTVYDYLAYHFPRVIRWSWEQRWHWIGTPNTRQNYSAPGFEWLMMPLFVVFKTDRFFFLINLIQYLFLPGLTFSCFRQLGISPRISWLWMWVLPCGYSYVLQAASVGNDLIAVVYFMASLHYVLQKGARTPGDWVLSCLSIALMTGAKASNIPLLLPWVIAVVLNRRRLFSFGQILSYAAVLPVAALVSFLPMAALNFHFTGDFTGDPRNRETMRLSNPVAGILGNTFEIGFTNFTPPYWPKQVNAIPVLPQTLRDRLQRDFPRFTLSMHEMQNEGYAGAGLGLVLFAVALLGMSVWARFRCPRFIVAVRQAAIWIVAGGVVALLVFMAKLGSEASARLVAAYYPLILAGASIGAALDGMIVRRRIVPGIALAAIVSAYPLILLNPARPLFPVKLVGDELSRLHAPAYFVDRYNEIYQLYASRFKAFFTLEKFIPESESNIGLVGGGNVPESSLWRPFGSRQVVNVDADAPLSFISNKQIHFVVVSQDALAGTDGLTVEDLLRRWSARLVAQKELLLLESRGVETWYLIQIPHP